MNLILMYVKKKLQIKIIFLHDLDWNFANDWTKFILIWIQNYPF